MDEIKADIAEIKGDSKLIQESMIRMEQRLDQKMEEKFEASMELAQKSFAILEGLAGKVADLDQENKMGALTLRRHDIQIHELATATSTTITE